MLTKSYNSAMPVYCKILKNNCPRTEADNGVCNECSEADMFLMSKNPSAIPVQQIRSSVDNSITLYAKETGRSIAGVRRGEII